MDIFGPRWPLKRGNEDTYQKYESIKDQINFYLKNLILTSPGENISSPTYGVGLRRYLFEQNTSRTRSLLRNKISSQISQHMPYLNVASISISSSADEIDNNSLSITIRYSIPRKINDGTFTLDSGEINNIGLY
jgi:phage baseplate assembly protein W